MATISLAKAGIKHLNTLMGDKPHSSITDWIEILSSSRYKEEDYEGIPELVDSINLQPGGPTEASRAIRKKLKYGDTHRQLRALTILKALVENCGEKFQSSLAGNAPLVERIKVMATDSMTDERVRKKLMSVLGSWHRQFKDVPSMSTVAGLYAACGGGKKYQKQVSDARAAELQRKAQEDAQRRVEAKEAERKAREDAKLKAKADRDKAKQPKPKRKPFNYAEEKPKIISSISTASQASANLINALKHVNREQETIEANARVQQCLTEAKAVRKVIVRYIQLVEDENVIGTLIDSNERIISALQLYDYMLKPADDDSDEEPDVTAGVQKMQLTGGSITGEPELAKLQSKQRSRIQRANSAGWAPQRASSADVHPDLQDLSFDVNDSSALPPPIRPSTESSFDEHRSGSLSDYSDYESSDEETHAAAVAGSSGQFGHRDYENVAYPQEKVATHALLDDEDPFADPFADNEVATPGIRPSKQTYF